MGRNREFVKKIPSEMGIGFDLNVIDYTRQWGKHVYYVFLANRGHGGGAPLWTRLPIRFFSMTFTIRSADVAHLVDMYRENT